MKEWIWERIPPGVDEEAHRDDNSSSRTAEVIKDLDHTRQPGDVPNLFIPRKPADHINAAQEPFGIGWPIRNVTSSADEVSLGEQRSPVCAKTWSLLSQRRLEYA